MPKAKLHISVCLYETFRGLNHKVFYKKDEKSLFLADKSKALPSS